ncbi:hypothetical protein BZG01_01635 [Labilibaculum manganireducens]|uniref:Uncharacterized protein n=1 Tax=Labilibaculum manganireducens TaxID=1940525 RepID=A0A2N3IFD7_9BACT|nr:hypothetical protein [Labilibaculum manganireducens]PKQ69034.1 hypothetical protein BZG01_01635 [Labilibaculum manganireducens]
MSGKLNNLQQFVQNAADTAWRASQNNSQYDPNPTGFGQHLEFTLQARSGELSRLLNEIAEDELNQVDKSPEPIDFTKFVRISNREFNHKEVFVGDKWVLVPNDANIRFDARTDSYAGTVQASFNLTISHNGDTATYTSSETYQQYQSNKPLVDNEQLLVKGQNLRLNDGELDWMRLGAGVYGVADKSANTANNFRSLYDCRTKDFKRKYTYKLSKIAPKAGKSGEIFQSLEKFAKKTKHLGKLCNIITFGTLLYEYNTDTWDAHSFVNAGLLAVSIIAVSAASAPIVTGIAIYGLLDLVFDVSGGIDDIFGRDSNFWNNQAIESYPTELLPLFNEARIDNTYVAPQFIKPLNFKD